MLSSTLLPGQDSSVGTATGYELNGPGIEFHVLTVYLTLRYFRSTVNRSVVKRDKGETTVYMICSVFL
jgi:hypothetical protein